MNSEASNPDASEKSWLEKIGQLFSGEPRTCLLYTSDAADD